MKRLFHHPEHPEQPYHGGRYYLLIGACLLLLGLLYVLWPR
ncbi:hypothetical protein [Cupriavidus pinatubonensis]